MILLEEVLSIHKILVQQFGGIQGVRDQAALESALARPFATFDGVDLYPSPQAKAAALIESILINHPFLDGNKRTGYTLMRLLLLNAQTDIKANQDEKYDSVIKTAAGQMKYEEIQFWLENHQP